MKVWYDKTTFSTTHRLGVRLDPGENEIPDTIAEKLIAIGLVSRRRPPRGPARSASEFSTGSGKSKTREEKESPPGGGSSGQPKKEEG